MSGWSPSRRRLLTAACGVVSTSSMVSGVAGSTQSGDDEPSVTLRHSPERNGYGSRDNYGTYKLIAIDAYRGEEWSTFAFGGDTGRSIRLRDEQTGAAIRFDPSSDLERLRLSRFEFRSPGWLIDERKLTVLREGGEFGDEEKIAGSYSGDTDVFQSRGVITATAELLDSSGDTVAATEPRPVGISYPDRLERNGSVLRIPIVSGVKDGWNPRLSLYQNIPSNPEVAITMDYGTDGEFFETDLAAVDPPAGDYDWIFELFESESPDLSDDSIITLGITELEGGWDGGPEETETDGEQTSSGSGPGVGAVGTAAAATGGAYLADRLRSED